MHHSRFAAKSGHLPKCMRYLESRKEALCAGHDQLERQAEAGELLGLQRLYVCTALSNQPNGGLAEPLKVLCTLYNVLPCSSPHSTDDAISLNLLQKNLRWCQQCQSFDSCCAWEALPLF